MKEWLMLFVMIGIIICSVESSCEGQQEQSRIFSDLPSEGSRISEISPQRPTDQDVFHSAQHQFQDKGETRTDLFNDDFEDGSISDWSVPGGGGCTAIVTTETAALNTYRSLKLVGGGSHYSGRYHTLNSITPGYISVWIRPTTTTMASNYIVVGDNNVSLNHGVIFFLADPVGQLKLYSVDGNHYCGTFSANTWYHIEFVLNWTTRRVDAYVDSVLKQSSVPFRNSVTTSLTQLHFYNFDNVTSYYDEVRIADTMSDTCLNCPNYDFGTYVPSESYSTITGSFGPGGCRSYRFCLDWSTTYRFSFCEGGGACSGDSILTLKTEDGCIYAAGNDNYCGASSQFDFSDSWYVWYILTVSGASGVGLNYTLAYKVVVPDTPTPTVSPTAPPTPTLAYTQTPTITPTPAPLPATGITGITLLLLIMGGLLSSWRSIRNRKF